MSSIPPVRFLREHPTIKTLFPQAGSVPDKGWDCMTVPNAQLVSINKFPIITLWDGYVLDEALLHPEHLPATLHMVNLITEELRRTDLYLYKRGEYINLSGTWAQGFFHWMLEYLPLAIAALESGFKGTFILPPTQLSLNSLLMLGVPRERMIIKDPGPWRIESLLVMRPINADRDLRRYPNFLQALRRRMLAAIGGVGQKGGRLYLGRRPDRVDTRRVVNEEALKPLLMRYGFRNVCMEDMPLKEQIGAAAGARCMIGPHGAGMLHCLFMEPESLVMEFFSPHYVNPCMLPIVEHLRHRYFMVPSTNIGGYAFGEDIEANVRMIEMTLQRELGNSDGGV
jgi:hypothetical protein